MPAKKYQLINHTADIGINVKGKDQNELFTNAAGALFDLMTNTKKVLPKDTRKITLIADNTETLMNFWLSALLKEFTMENYLLDQVRITKITEKEITASVTGELFNPKKHRIKKEIKAVTFHDLSVTKNKKGWQAQVIFDV